MALIIETGFGTNPAANSYATVSEFRSYATARGVAVTLYTDAQCEVYLIKAMDYLESKADTYKGKKSQSSQALQFPRYDMYGVLGDDDELFPSTSIPPAVKSAQCQLAIESISNDLLPTAKSGKGNVIREKIEGAVEVAYSENGALSAPSFPKVDALLSCVTNKKSMFFNRA